VFRLLPTPKTTMKKDSATASMSSQPRKANSTADDKTLRA
jgi:hypothetical protein